MEGCKREWNGCKGNPTGPVWLDPQTDCLDRVNRNRATPGNALRELMKPIVTLEGSILCRCLIFTSGKVYCLADLMLMYCTD